MSFLSHAFKLPPLLFQFYKSVGSKRQGDALATRLAKNGSLLSPSSSDDTSSSSSKCCTGGSKMSAAEDTKAKGKAKPKGSSKKRLPKKEKVTCRH